MEKRSDVRKKMAIACFISGVLGTVIGLLVRSEFCFLGTIAGALAGYLAYDFREVLKAIPEALRRSSDRLGEKIDELVAWGKEKHPYVYASFFLALFVMKPVGYIFCGYNASCSAWYDTYIGYPVVCIVSYMLAVTVALVLVAFNVMLGQLWCKQTHDDHSYPAHACESIAYVELTYGRFLKWLVIGSFWPVVAVYNVVKYTILFAFYYFWVWAKRFIKELVRLIHSTERLCCGCYGAFGGTVAFLYGIFFMPDRTPTDVAFLAVCGGLLGAVSGLFMGRKLLSKGSARALSRQAGS